MSIYYETKLNKLPENCNRCRCEWCRLPYEFGAYDLVFKKEYMTQRHKDCPLKVIKD